MIKAWCVFCPYGNVLSIGNNKKKSIANFLEIDRLSDSSEMYEWYVFESQEYTCVPVQITEEADDE